MFRIFFLGAITLFFGLPGLWAQESRELEPIICTASERPGSGLFIPPPARAGGRDARGTAQFIFDFNNVPDDIQQAVEYAGEIWSFILFSEVPIRVEVNWTNLGENTLASSGPTQVFRTRELPRQATWYPVALAESLVGRGLNDADPDIRIALNRNQNWYTGTNGRPAQNQLDLVTVIVHELAHGLGFLSTAEETEQGEGTFGIERLPIIYDLFVADQAGELLTDQTIYPQPSVMLLEALGSENLFFDGPIAAEAHSGENPPLYAPAEFNAGSSISHLDEEAFPFGTENSLMSPNIRRGEAIHDPGPVTVAIMQEIGWEATPLDKDQNLDFEEFALVPNPADRQVQLRIPVELADQDLQIQLFDLSGRLLRQERSRRLPLVQFSLVQLPPGTYVFRLQGESEAYTLKLAVAR